MEMCISGRYWSFLIEKDCKVKVSIRSMCVEVRDGYDLYKVILSENARNSISL